MRTSPALRAAMTVLTLTGAEVCADTAVTQARTRPGYAFHDEFTGPAARPPDAARWRQLTGCRWGHGAERQCYTVSGRNARLDGHGHLIITARRDDHTGTDGTRRKYTSTRLVSTSALGAGSLRAKMSGRQAGAWPAIWLLAEPSSRSAPYGEIDLMENGLSGPGWRPQYYVPTDRGSAGGTYDVEATGWHVYTVTWSTGRSGRVRFFVDDRPVGDFPYRMPRGSRAHLILNIAVGSHAGRPAPDLHSTLTVDYVRVSDGA